MFAYYAKWIHNFSDKIRPLVENTKYSLEMKAVEAFKQIKQDLEVAAQKPIDERLPFEVECDASDVAFSAVLNQGKVSYYREGSHGNCGAVRKWIHYLTHQHFTLITVQRSVTLMFFK